MMSKPTDLPNLYVLPARLDDSQRADIISNIKSKQYQVTESPQDAIIFVGDVLGPKRALLELRFLGLNTTDTTTTKTPAKGTKILKVAKLEWYTKAIIEGVDVNIDDFIIYNGIYPARSPSSNQPATTSLTPRKRSASPPTLAEKQAEERSRSESILRRAMAATHQAAPGTRHLRHKGYSQDLQPSQPFKRPKLISQQSTDSQEESEQIASNLPPLPQWVIEKQKYSCARSTPAESPNKDFLEALFKIRLNRTLISDKIGVRAYSTSIASIAALPYKITHISQIHALPGCEGKIAALWYEFTHSVPPGRLEVLEEIEKSVYYKTLKLFYNIWGAGSHSAQSFYKQGFRDLDDLVEHHWEKLTRVQQIGVKFYDEFQDKIPRDEVISIRDSVQNYARQLLPGAEAAVVGGFRRGKELSNDVDLLITHPRVSKSRDVEELLVPLVDLLEKEGLITHVLTIHQPSRFVAATGGDVWPKRSHHNFDGIPKVLCVWQQPDLREDEEGDSQMGGQVKQGKNPNPHRRVDILLPPPRCAGSTLTSWSGATTFERDLRKYVREEKYWKFSSEGVTDRASGMRVPVGKEEGEFIGLTEEDEKNGVEVDDNVDNRERGKGGEWVGWDVEERKLFKLLELEWREPTERCTG
ncbi:uncharacterized protein DFL_003889 [Arthrobotrys flagrans]|uniref:DNA polymerase n=1 Tax=Arthrobotrys flagrans TaxID=97331 RepID=A0A437A362_ARTFL|nr:hypothetical protein DFL_003889 [Arthrobotrys flagrans]